MKLEDFIAAMEKSAEAFRNAPEDPLLRDNNLRFGVCSFLLPFSRDFRSGRIGYQMKEIFYAAGVRKYSCYLAPTFFLGKSNAKHIFQHEQWTKDCDIIRARACEKVIKFLNENPQAWGKLGF